MRWRIKSLVRGEFNRYNLCNARNCSVEYLKCYGDFVAVCICPVLIIQRTAVQASLVCQLNIIEMQKYEMPACWSPVWCMWLTNWTALVYRPPVPDCSIPVWLLLSLAIVTCPYQTSVAWSSHNITQVVSQGYSIIVAIQNSCSHSTSLMETNTNIVMQPSWLVSI